MGSGSWSRDSFRSYTSVTKNLDLDYDGSVKYRKGTTSQDIYRTTRINEALKPMNVMRECVDTDEHPNTIPVILALDVTGSMGEAAVEVSRKIGTLMEDLFKRFKDIEVMIMGIGDLAYDRSPIQISQFESDIRIAEQLDKLYFEYGGGGNNYESYTAAWYMGSRHTKLDCWNRGKKGVIITLGDEAINPYLPSFELRGVTGDDMQDSINTDTLYEEAKEKFDIYHILVNHNCASEIRNERNISEWKEKIGENNVVISTVNGITQNITNFIEMHIQNEAQIEEPVVISEDNTENTEEATEETVFDTIFNNEITW